MNTAFDLDELSDEQLTALYSWPAGPSLRLNMLIGPRGLTTGGDGTSHSLTTPADRRVLRTIRAESDAVVVGAASVRSEGWFLPPHGPLLVISASGNLPWESCPDPSRVQVFSSMQELTSWLQAHPGRILCEGGLETARAIEQILGFTDIALTAHIDPREALSLITDRPGDFTFVHHGTHTNADKGTSEGFYLWRRAAQPKE